jgi:hypothetical protein
VLKRRTISKVCDYIHDLTLPRVQRDGRGDQKNEMRRLASWAYETRDTESLYYTHYAYSTPSTTPNCTRAWQSNESCYDKRQA